VCLKLPAAAIERTAMFSYNFRHRIVITGYDQGSILTEAATDVCEVQSPQYSAAFKARTAWIQGEIFQLM
jgi:hypothetical protein